MSDDDAKAARGARYKAARLRTGLSQRQLAKKLGLSAQAISKWESGEGDATKDNARALAQMSGCRLEWLLIGNGLIDSGDGNVSDYTEQGKRVPVVGNTVHGILPANERQGLGSVYARFPCSDDAKALIVSGDSMAPDFLDGDVIVIDPSVDPAPGDFVYVEVGTTKLFRRFRPQAQAGAYDLIPSNHDWPTIKIAPDDKAVMCGVMTEHTRPRRRRA